MLVVSTCLPEDPVLDGVLPSAGVPSMRDLSPAGLRQSNLICRDACPCEDSSAQLCSGVGARAASSCCLVFRGPLSAGSYGSTYGA